MQKFAFYSGAQRWNNAASLVTSLVSSSRFLAKLGSEDYMPMLKAK